MDASPYFREQKEQICYNALINQYNYIWERNMSPLLQACYNINKQTLPTCTSILICHVPYKHLCCQFLSPLDRIPWFVRVMSHIKKYGWNLIFTPEFLLGRVAVLK